ncbi:hypothetical protein THAOC_13890, partial [Thalassiosira oceanica]
AIDKEDAEASTASLHRGHGGPVGAGLPGGEGLLLPGRVPPGRAGQCSHRQARCGGVSEDG